MDVFFCLINLVRCMQIKANVDAFPKMFFEFDSHKSMIPKLFIQRQIFFISMGPKLLVDPQ